MTDKTMILALALAGAHLVMAGEIVFEGDLTAYFRTQGESVGAGMSYQGRTSWNGDTLPIYDSNESSFGLYHAFDGVVNNQSSRFLANVREVAIEYGVGFSYAADHDVVVTNLTLWCPPGSANPPRMPKNFHLSGYNDLTGEWTILGEWESAAFVEGEQRSFLVPVENRAPYRLYRFTCASLQSKNEPYFCVNELAFGGYIRKRDSPVDYGNPLYSGDLTRYFRLQAKDGTATVSIASYLEDDETPTSGETLGTCERAFDGGYGNHGRWGANIIPSWLHYEVASTALEGYDVIVQNIEVLPSFALRNLRGFELQGWDSRKGVWKTLLMTEDYHNYTADDYNNCRRYGVAVPAACQRGYAKYRLHLIKPRGGSGSGYYIDVGEVVLFGKIVKHVSKGLMILLK
jgi:hypothetical protein